MSTDSSVAGYLSPSATPAPLEDDALDTFLHDLLVGVTGLPGDMIRPRWQPEPPTQPARDVDWMAFGVMDEDPDTYSAVIHNANGSDEMQRHENFSVLISSYGLNARANLGLLRDGIQLEQNRAILSANIMGLVETGRVITAPALVKDGWLRRFDMTMVLRRQVRRIYSVKNLASMDGILDTEVIQTSIDVSPPAP